MNDTSADDGRLAAHWRRHSPWWIAAAVSALALLAARPLVEQVDLAVLDLLNRGVVAPLHSVRTHADAGADSIVVAIDDASLQELGRWPWPRQRHAELIDVLRNAGAQAVGYNVLFSEPAVDPADDERLARAIAEHGQIVLPVVPGSHATEPVADPGAGTLRPLALLERSAAALGHAEAPIDRDGLVRRVAMATGSGAATWEAMPLAVQRIGAPQASTPPPGTAPRAPARTPWWREPMSLLPAGGATIPQVSAAALLGDPAQSTLLTGRVVWVGLTARGIEPGVSVPGPHGTDPLSAVHWQARLHQALEQNRMVAIASAPLVLAANVLPLVLAALFGRRAMRALGLRWRAFTWLLPLPLLAEAVLLGWGRFWLPLGAMGLGWLVALAVIRAMELHATRSDLRRERGLAEATLHTITDAVITLDAAHRIRYANPSAERLLRAPTAGPLHQHPIQQALHLPEPEQQILQRALDDCRREQRTIAIGAALHLVTHDGEHLARAVVSPMRTDDMAGQGSVLVLTDVTATARAEQLVEHGSTHDALTGLPNRVLLSTLLTHALAHGRHQHEALAVLFIDLDRFGRINDSLGQRQGDEVLTMIATRMREVFRPHDTLARWGGDQFVVLLEDVTSREVVAALASQLIDVVTRDMRIGDTAIACTCSVGIALSPDDAPTTDGLLSLAQAAMTRAKAAGGGRFEFYTSGMSTLTRDWLALENRLRHALEAGEFVLHYQVQTDLRTGRPVGLEALLRWRQEDGELWAPGRFLSITEETGLIVAVGNWVIREATAQLRRWIDAGVAPVPVSVNVSARQCMDSQLIEVIASALREADVPPSLLKVEITESTAMADLEHLHRLLMQLRQLGVAISLDDFGTGFSSLAHLRRFPVDQIKIDPSFIADIHQDPNGAAIVRATIALAHGLGVPVVAEGVENDAQIRFLREHQCDLVQGYLYGRPGSPDAIGQVLTSADVHPRYLHPESRS